MYVGGRLTSWTNIAPPHPALDNPFSEHAHSTKLQGPALVFFLLGILGCHLIFEHQGPRALHYPACLGFSKVFRKAPEF